MTRRRAPRPAATAFQAALQRVAPKTRLAAVQSVWTEVVGDQLASVAQPISERDGLLTVVCADTVWTEELSLMGAQLEHALRERLGDDAPTSLRFRVKADAS
jgi:predicted nucleic acid-binding Zn ribbon protein